MALKPRDQDGTHALRSLTRSPISLNRRSKNWLTSRHCPPDVDEMERQALAHKRPDEGTYDDLERPIS